MIHNDEQKINTLVGKGALGRLLVIIHSILPIIQVNLNPFHPKFKKDILPTFLNLLSEYIGSIIIFHLSELWKARPSYCVMLLLLVRLQDKFVIDHYWEWKGWR